MMKRQTDDSNELVKGSIEYFFKNNRFRHLLKETKKYKDLFNSKEAFFSLILSLATSTILLSVAKGISSFSEIRGDWDQALAQSNIETAVELIRTLVITNVAGLFGLLGFVIGGLSILSGTISVKVIDSINDEGKIKYLIRIMFSFYYIGALIGITLVASFLTYMITYLSFRMSTFILVFWSLCLSYISYFTIISCVMLMGTSLRFFILNYWYYLKEKSKTE